MMGFSASRIDLVVTSCILQCHFKFSSEYPYLDDGYLSWVSKRKVNWEEVTKRVSFMVSKNITIKTIRPGRVVPPSLIRPSIIAPVTFMVVFP